MNHQAEDMTTQTFWHYYHYSDVIMGAMASQITSLTIVYSTVYSGADQRKHQNSASLAYVRGIHRWPVNSLHKWPVTRKMFPFYDVIMSIWSCVAVKLFLVLISRNNHSSCGCNMNLFTLDSWVWYQVQWHTNKTDTAVHWHMRND